MKEEKRLHQKPRQEIGVLIKRAYELMTSDPQGCIDAGCEALALSEKHQDGIGKGHALLHIGLGYFHQGDYAEAFRNYRQAEEIFQKENHNFGLRNAYNNIGIIYDCWDEHEKALEYYQKTLDIKSEMVSPGLRCNTLKNIGIVHEWAQDYKTAREYYQRALQCARENGFDYGISLCLSALGKLLLKENKVDEGLVLIRQSIEIHKRTNNVFGIISDLELIASAMFRSKRYDEALSYLEQALEKSLQTNNKQSLASIYLQIASIYRQRGDIDREIEYLQMSLEISRANQYRNFLNKGLQNLAKAYADKGSFEIALKTYWQFQEVHDTIADENRLKNINKLRIQMEVAEKEREMELIRKSNTELEKKNALISRQKTKLERMEKKLRDLNRDLEMRVIEEVERRRQQEQLLIQKSKLESLGRMAAGIAHEINQPLGMINLAVQNLFNKLQSKQADAKYIDEKGESIRQNIDRISKIIEHIRLFSRDQQAIPLEAVDVCRTIGDALSMTEIQCKNQNITISRELSDIPLVILGNKYRLEQVILNLISNAKDALDDRYDYYDDRKEITVRCSRSGAKAIIEIEDNGSGIEEDALSHIFDPFFTTKSENRGTGLGLSICYGIVKDMQGSIECSSQREVGTVMRLSFNLLDREEIT